MVYAMIIRTTQLASTQPVTQLSLSTQNIWDMNDKYEEERLESQLGFHSNSSYKLEALTSMRYLNINFSSN